MTSSIRKTLTSKQKKDVDEYLSINRLCIINNYKNLWDGIKYYRDLDGKLSANQIKSLKKIYRNRIECLDKRDHHIS